MTLTRPAHFQVHSGNIKETDSRETEDRRRQTGPVTGHEEHSAKSFVQIPALPRLSHPG